MAFIITGDTHGTLDSEKVIKFFTEHEDEYSEDDYLIILGDVGVCGFSPTVEKETRKILRELPVTVLFIDGNHEHHQRLNEYPVDQWMGGKVHFIEPGIIHLMRGQVYDIEGTRFFTFGGAYSVDRYARTEGVDWFPEEIPSREEYEEGLDNLENAVTGLITSSRTLHRLRLQLRSDMGKSHLMKLHCADICSR